MHVAGFSRSLCPSIPSKSRLCSFSIFSASHKPVNLQNKQEQIIVTKYKRCRLIFILNMKYLRNFRYLVEIHPGQIDPVYQSRVLKRWLEKLIPVYTRYFFSWFKKSWILSDHELFEKHKYSKKAVYFFLKLLWITLLEEGFDIFHEVQLNDLPPKNRSQWQTVCLHT